MLRDFQGDLELCLQMQWIQVQSFAGKLKSHMVCGAAENKKQYQQQKHSKYSLSVGESDGKNNWRHFIFLWLSSTPFCVCVCICIYIYTHVCVCACMLSHFSHVQLFCNPMDYSPQAPLFMEFSRQEYWSGLPCPPPRDRPDPGIKPISLMSPALAGRFFTTSAT